MPSLLDSTPQTPAAGAWGSLYAAQDPVKPRHVTVAPTAKKPAYGGGATRKKKNLETCTETLGCETGAVDVAPAGFEAEAAECAERKRRAREEAAEAEMEQRARRPLPPPLTTLLAHGGSRVRMVHERRDGRLSVYAVRTPAVEAERSGGRLRMRLLPPLPCGGAAGNATTATAAAAAACHQKPQEAETVAEEEEHGGVAKYVRGGRCVEPEGAAAAAAAASRRGSKQWEPEQAAAFWVATS
ncbi:unnamed protein product [Urochloa decumbens]|uniref:FAF domain-containing protein n=1 Tax=Urochloa decumbens TaxID=240449 RepID=A0ABC8WE73_9POAL